MKIAVFDLETGAVMAITDAQESDIHLTHGDVPDEAVRVLDGTAFSHVSSTRTIDSEGKAQPTLTLAQFDAG